MEEGLFPHQMSADDPNRLEEERRLCYVGITRAEKSLVFSYAEQRQLHGQTKFNPPSRLRELPNDLIQEIRPKLKTNINSAYRTQTANNVPKISNRYAESETGYAHNVCAMLNSATALLRAQRERALMHACKLILKVQALNG